MNPFAHLQVPEQLWLPLGLSALAPIVLLAIVAPLARRRARGIATMVTLQTIVLLSLGFAVLAAVATISVVRTGLTELRERHASAVRLLARDLEQAPLGLAGPSMKIQLALFRARNPSVSFVAVGTDACRAECVISGTDDRPLEIPSAQQVAALWPASTQRATLAPVAGRSLLVVTEPMRPAGFTRPAGVVVGIRADAVADQATVAAWIVLAIGYCLLAIVGWRSWRQLDHSLGARIAAITRQVRSGTVSDENAPLGIDGRELRELASAVTAYIQETVEEQRSSDERYRRLVELAPDGVLMCSDTGIKFANSAALTMAGVKSRYDVIGRPITAFLQFESMRAHETPGTLRPAKWTRADGGVLHVEVAEITDRAARDGNHQYMVRDVTARRAREAVLAHKADHDALTGLVNRARFETRLVDLLDARARTPASDRTRQVAVLFIDLDGFKPVNDRHGHAAGDAVLVSVAARLRECTRGTDAIARLGGDEFAVVIEVREIAEVTAVVDRILESLTRPVFFGGNELVVGASIGTADTRCLAAAGIADGETAAVATELLRVADAAMYAVKGGKPRESRRDGPIVAQSLRSPTGVSFRDVA